MNRYFNSIPSPDSCDVIINLAKFLNTNKISYEITEHATRINLVVICNEKQKTEIEEEFKMELILDFPLGNKMMF